MRVSEFGIQRDSFMKINECLIVLLHFRQNDTALVNCYYVIRFDLQKLAELSQRLWQAPQFEERRGTEIQQVHTVWVRSKSLVARLDCQIVAPGFDQDCRVVLSNFLIRWLELQRTGNKG